VLEPEFDEAERRLPAFRRVGYNLCQYVLISVSGPQAKSRDLDYTETLLLLTTQLQDEGNITKHFVNRREINLGYYLRQKRTGKTSWGSCMRNLVNIVHVQK
jgi:hypothetical protein